MSIPIKGSGKPNQPFVVEGKKTPKEPMQVASGLVHQNEFLQKQLGGKEGIDTAIALLRNDRLSNSKLLTEFLKEKIAELPKVNDNLIKEDPLLSMLVLILNNDPSEEHLRKEAAETYIDKHPEDERFGKTYAYLKDPHILVAHLLIKTNQWKCVNPKDKTFYDDQMAGLFKGTVSFAIGDRLSPDELGKIQKQEGENPQYPIADKLEKKEDYFEVKKWCSTPPMCPSKTRLDDLFIKSRRSKQKSVIEDYIASLKETSSIVEKKYSLPPNKSAAVAVLGPLGVGKSEFTRRKFSKEITTFDLDGIDPKLRDIKSRKQDHHFEAMMVEREVLSRLTEVPALLKETAAVDKRFDTLVDRDFASRNPIIIEEIATERPTEATDRFKTREGKVDLSWENSAIASANSALENRSKRIKKAIDNPKITYTLYCSTKDNKGNPVFIVVAKVEDGNLEVAKGQEKLYEKLTPLPYQKSSDRGSLKIFLI